MGYPAQFQYTAEHQWVEIKGREARIGITHYAQGQLGDVVFVEFPPVGAKYSKGESIVVIESVKAISDIPAPFSGTIIDINTALEETPELLNSDPHNKGWVIIMKMDDPADTESLLSVKEYERLIAEAEKEE
ncbi:glycine cleavage system protein GcvH [Candidatus Acetothermia bacterium]|jgi:glycine cleavage system H protein|nr:glycine cleavage system protein GcvH [Candidatus Acetothermia bacterium]MCI2427658.1 glycine cleavage system protein GcvH [Candidatus Acetothermia bacterium]MCI2428824.1 glycine cleavage system protein GcvH [Candidatus Acetothermia bacterium]